MKKVILIISILVVLFSIVLVCTKGSSNNNNQSTEHTTTIESQTGNEEITENTGDIESTEATPEDATPLSSYELDISSATDSQLEELVTTEFPDCFDLELELIYQNPELPAGCESVSLTMILNYLGYDIDKTHIVDEHLVHSGNFVMGYCGDPYSYVGGGCYAPGMTLTANSFLEANGNKHTAENITGTNFDVLLEYVAQGHPILIWTTINMADCSKSHYNYDEEGNAYAWDYNEHCVVLTGYDLKAGTVTVYDPIAGIVYRDKEAFQNIYEKMNEMAIIIK